MSNIPSASNPLRELWSRLTDSLDPAQGSTPTSPRSTSPSSAAAATDAARDAAVERLPSPSVSLATVVARMDPVAAKLDQLKAAASGPYTVNGVTVYSGIQFRLWEKGFNQAAVNDPQTSRTLIRVANTVGLASRVPELQSGRADVATVVKMTQALIDSGQLPAGSTKSLPDQIHDLQWRFAIGLDCAGYVYQAVTAVHGDPSKLGLKPTGNENFTGLPQNSRFAKVAETSARPGDVIVLAGKGAEFGDPGHNLIVRSHATLAPTSDAITSHWSGTDAFMAGAGPIHVFEVDSSFSAGEHGSASGGVRRDVLLFDATSKMWLTCRETVPPVAIEDKVPYAEHALTGVFRPKVSQ